MPGSDVSISAVDPDSMFINPSGDLTLDNQSGTALISIHNPGPPQTVTSVTVGTQVDDTVYPGANTGRVLVADTKADAISPSAAPWTPKTRWSPPRTTPVSMASSEN